MTGRSPSEILTLISQYFPPLACPFVLHHRKQYAHGLHDAQGEQDAQGELDAGHSPCLRIPTKRIPTKHSALLNTNTAILKQFIKHH